MIDYVRTARELEETGKFRTVRGTKKKREKTHKNMQRLPTKDRPLFVASFLKLGVELLLVAPCFDDDWITL